MRHRPVQERDRAQGDHVEEPSTERDQREVRGGLRVLVGPHLGPHRLGGALLARAASIEASLTFCTLPVSVTGSSSRRMRQNSWGTLYAASAALQKARSASGSMS